EAYLEATITADGRVDRLVKGTTLNPWLELSEERFLHGDAGKTAQPVERLVAAAQTETLLNFGYVRPGQTAHLGHAATLTALQAELIRNKAQADRMLREWSDYLPSRAQTQTERRMVRM